MRACSLPHPGRPTTLSRTRVGEQGHLPHGGGWARAQCGKVTNGDAPAPALCPASGRGRSWKRIPAGAFTRPGMRTWRPSPARGCPGSEGLGAPRAHPPARGIQPRDRRRRRRPCPAPGSVCKVSKWSEEKCPPTPKWAGRQGAQVSELGREAGWNTWICFVQPARCTSS